MARSHCKVFVSYSRHDEALVRPLAGLLGAAANDSVFLDVNSLKPGELWEEKILEAVKQAKVFVLCWCCESRKSGFVSKELEAALFNPEKKLIPVLFCPAELPESIRGYQWIDLRGQVIHQCSCAKPAKKKKALLPRSPLPMGISGPANPAGGGDEITQSDFFSDPNFLAGRIIRYFENLGG